MQLKQKIKTYQATLLASSDQLQATPEQVPWILKVRSL